MIFAASRRRIVATWIVTVLIGYAIFIAPNLFFGIFKVGGGLAGWNLAIVGIVQLLGILVLLFVALRSLGATFSAIGWENALRWREALVGALAGLAFVMVEMFVVVPATGGAAEPDVARIIEGMEGSVAGLAGYLILGVVGGGIAEELFNRGFMINGLRAAFTNQRLGL